MKQLYTFTGLLACLVLLNTAVWAQEPQAAVLEYNKGVILLKQGKEWRAMRHFKQAFKHDQGHTEAGLKLVKYYTQKGKFKKAARFTPHLVDLGSDSEAELAEKSYYQAYLNIQTLQYMEARQRLNSSIHNTIRAESPDYHLLAQCYNALGYLEVVQQGVNSRGRKARKHIKIHPNDMRKAMKQFRLALEYEPDNEAAQANYRAICQLLGLTPRSVTPVHSRIEPNKKKVATKSTDNGVYFPILENSEVLIDQLNQHEEVVLIVDISGSMRVPLNDQLPVSRFEAMRNTVLQVLEEVDEDVRIGIITLGGDCDQPPYLKMQAAANNRSYLQERVKALPKDGHTPLNDVLKVVPDLFTGQTYNRAVMLLTDGIASCNPEKTCRTAAQFGDMGVFMHVMSFLMKTDAHAEEYSSYECITKNASGKLLSISTEGKIKLEKVEILTDEQLLLPKIERDTSLRNVQLMFRTNVGPSSR